MALPTRYQTKTPSLEEIKPGERVGLRSAEGVLLAPGYYERLGNELVYNPGQADARPFGFGGTGGVGSEVGAISSKAAEQMLREDLIKLDGLAGTTTTADTTGSPPTEKPESPKESVTFIKPDTEQKQTISSSELTTSLYDSLKSQGFELAESTSPVTRQMLEAREAEKDLENLKKRLSDFTVTDSALQGQISAINQQWDARISDMQRTNRQREAAINTLGVRIGSRYTGGAGGVFGGIVAEEERAGVQRIAELEASKQTAISAAREAARTKNWEVFTKEVSIAETKYKEKIETIKELNKTITENNKKIQEGLVQSTRDNAVAGLFAQGITDPVKILSTLNESGGDFTIKEISDSIKEIRDAQKEENEKFSGDYGVFLNLKETGQLSSEISSLPNEQEQFLAFRKMLNPEKPPDPTLQAYRRLATEKLSRELAALDPTVFDRLTPESEPYARAATNILQSTKFSSDERQFAMRAITEKLSNGKINEAKENIILLANDKLGTEAQTQAMGRYRALAGLDYIKQIIQEAEREGAGPGLFSGSIENVANKLGLQSNPELRRLSVLLGEFLITYRKSQTGVAFGEQEAKDYKKMIPAITDYAPLAINKLDSLREALDLNQKATYEFVIGPSAYREIFGKIEPQRSDKTVLLNPEGQQVEFDALSSGDIQDALRQGWKLP